MNRMDLQAFVAFMQAHVAPGEKVLAAVSGGADSMALLDLLLRYAEPVGYDVVVAHVHHHLREASDEEWRFVENYCKKRGVLFLGQHVWVREARAQGESLEACAHRLRHRALREMMEVAQADWLALAHQADDRAETVLMNILRGCALKGLAAMPAQDGRLLRPLLAYTKAELETYCHDADVPYVTDESNHDTTILRNRLRHELLPVLRTYNPQIVSALTRLAENSACVCDHLTEEAEALYNDSQIFSAKSWCMLARTPLLECHEAVLAELLQLIAARFSRGRGVLRQEMVTLFCRQVRTGSGRGDLGQGMVFECTRRAVFIGHPPKGAWYRHDTGWHHDELEAELILPETMTVRTYASGDSIAIKNLGRKSLKKIFQEEALPSCLRKVWPLVCDTKIKEIIWVPFLAHGRQLMYYNSATNLKVVLSACIAQRKVNQALTAENKDK